MKTSQVSVILVLRLFASLLLKQCSLVSTVLVINCCVVVVFGCLGVCRTSVVQP